jgi:hypothetical protein
MQYAMGDMAVVVSGNRYFTENCPSGTVMLLNLKLLNCPLLLCVTKILASEVDMKTEFSGFVWHMSKI